MVDAVREYCVFVIEAMEDNEFVETVFCDLFEAFNCLSRDFILRKLVCLKMLVASFLSGRRQLVVAGGKDWFGEHLYKRVSGVDAWTAAFSGDE